MPAHETNARSGNECRDENKAALKTNAAIKSSLAVELFLAAINRHPDVYQGTSCRLA